MIQKRLLDESSNKTVCVDLEDAALNYSGLKKKPDEEDEYYAPFLCAKYYDFIAGAKWQIERSMKNKITQNKYDPPTITFSSAEQFILLVDKRIKDEIGK